MSWNQCEAIYNEALILHPENPWLWYDLQIEQWLFSRANKTFYKRARR